MSKFADPTVEDVCLDMDVMACVLDGAADCAKRLRTVDQQRDAIAGDQRCVGSLAKGHVDLMNGGADGNGSQRALALALHTKQYAVRKTCTKCGSSACGGEAQPLLQG